MAKILIVDDEPSLRELLKDYLELAGHSVETAETGMEGLTKLREGRFQLATLDVDMPSMSGLDVLKLIRRDPKLARLPVLMCTARDMMSSVDDAFDEGASGYIVKPFDFATVGKSVAKALSGTAGPVK